MKKIIVVGATGRLGREVVEGLEVDYEVIRAGRSGPDLKIDAFDFESVSGIFASVGSFDGLVSCIGGTPLNPSMSYQWKISRQVFQRNALVS